MRTTYIGFIGPIQEAKQIKEKVKDFLSDKLGLELSQEKTLITHAASGRAHFLGYEINKELCNTKLTLIKQGSQKGENGEQLMA